MGLLKVHQATLLMSGRNSEESQKAEGTHGSPPISHGKPIGLAHLGSSKQLWRHPQWSYCPGTSCPLAQQSGGAMLEA